MQQPHQKASILLVDDYVDPRGMYAEALSNNGYNLTAPGDGQEAIEKAVAADLT